MEEQPYSVRTGIGTRPALYLPGTGWYAETGDPVAQAIAGSHTTYLLDLPGIGRSKGPDRVVTLDDLAPWIEDYLDAGALGAVDLIGHSLGGLVALAFAVARPGRTRSLILLDTGYAKTPRIPTEMFGPAACFAPLVDTAHRIFGGRILGRSATHDRPSDPHRDHPDIGAHGLALMLAGYRADPPALLHALQAPCLLLYGDRSGESPRRRERVIRRMGDLRRLHNVETVALTGGHYAHETDPRALEAIRAFMDRT